MCVEHHPGIWFPIRMAQYVNSANRLRDHAIDNEANPEQVQGAPNPAMNPTVDLHKTKEEAIKEFVRQQGTIALDWYVPDFHNTRVGDLIKERLPIETTEGRILFSFTPLSEFFKTSNFELDLRTGRVYTFLTPPEDIGVSCKQEQFDLELLTELLQREKIQVQYTRKNSKESQ